MAWVPAVVASREEQLGDSEIKEDRIKDKETRQTRYRIQNEPRGSVDLHLDTFGYASGASPGSNSVNLMLVRVATRRQKQREERSWFSVTLLVVVAGHER